jgi:hypothetical protein
MPIMAPGTSRHYTSIMKRLTQPDSETPDRHFCLVRGFNSQVATNRYIAGQATTPQ